ncbi:MAG: SDR family NAD(P)-dependent oxidoreductase [Lentisphaeria bacterium]|nr:SDR family NAD(P)-dependent oxidoreductase [Lentisphaeria bacterium]
MKVILTGASRGIGKGIARVLSKQGCQLGLIARSEDALKNLAEILPNTSYRVADMQDPDATETAIAELIAEMGGVDALINNAALILKSPVDEISVEDWQATMATNVNGPFYCTRAVIPSMKEQGSGHIVNISSISGKLPLKGGSAYAASKYALRGFSDSIFLELRDFGIKVTCVFPGSVDRDESADSWKLDPEEIGESIYHLLNTSPQNCIRELEIRPLRKP